MKNISKITTKYFLHPRIVPTEYIIGGAGEDGKYDENLVPHPLYLKVTFKRRSTEIRSIINGDFYSLREAISDYQDLMEVETRMIGEIISHEYNKVRNKCGLKGLKGKYEYYEKPLLEFFSETFLWDQFKAVVKKSRSEFSRLLLVRDPRIPVGTYYRAALKLIPEVSGLKDFNEKSEILGRIEGIFRKIEKDRSVIIASWLYGKVKEQFTIEGLKRKMKRREVQELIAHIDKIVGQGRV